MTRDDRIAALVLWAATFLIFAAGAGRLGFYYDDGPAMTTLPQSDLRGLFSHILNYVPGRNLHVLWQYLFLKLTTNLTVLHLVQSALDGAVVVVFFFLLRRLAIPAPAALLAAAFFSFWPTHGETHFWLYAVPQNLLSTLFVLLFALTLNPVFFLTALFTYDQTVVVLLLLVILRRRPLHLLYLIPTAFFVWLKIVHAPGRGPSLRSDALQMLLTNIPGTVSATIGRRFFEHLALLYAKVTPTDWLLAALAAVAITVVALRLRPESSPRPVALVALVACMAAYLPIWLWHMSQRHHYLPSAALFAFLSAGLPTRRYIAVLGIPVFFFAAASRGESRYWEESFTRKKQLFTGLRPQLQDKQILVLEGFPLYHGPAYFITPPDPAYAPRLLFPDSTITLGDISGSPAPSGIFLYTSLHHHGPEAFRYFPTDRFVVAPPRPVPYEILPPEPGASLRRDGPDAILTFPVTASVRHLSAVISFLQPNGLFHPWQGPVLLGAPGQYSLRLGSFPATDRARIEFYEASPNDPPRRLGRLEVSPP